MTKPTALAFNVFAGAFTVGVRRHYQVLAHVEHGHYGATTASLNFRGLPVYVDRDRWPDPRVPELWDGQCSAPDVADGRPARFDLIYGNPPCALWSQAGGSGLHGRERRDWRTDPRLAMITQPFRLLETHRPRAWVWESVTGAYTRGGALVADLTAQAQDLGYDVTYVLLDARWLGCPQTRRRFFFVAHDYEVPWRLPRFEDPPTAAETLANVEPDVDRYPYPATAAERRLQRLARKAGPGRALRKVFDLEAGHEVDERGVVARRPSFLEYTLHPDRPASTIIGPKKWHWSEGRRLAISELLALGGFPPTFKFDAKTHHAAADLLARGVMPPVARWLAGNLARGVKAQPRRRRRNVRGRTWLLDVRKPPGLYCELDAVPLDL